MYLFTKSSIETADNDLCKVGRLSVYRSWGSASPRASSRSSARCCVLITLALAKLARFAKFWRARSRMYRSRFLQVNMRFAASSISTRCDTSAYIVFELDSNFCLRAPRFHICSFCFWVVLPGLIQFCIPTFASLQTHFLAKYLFENQRFW